METYKMLLKEDDNRLFPYTETLATMKGFKLVVMTKAQVEKQIGITSGQKATQQGSEVVVKPKEERMGKYWKKNRFGKWIRVKSEEV